MTSKPAPPKPAGPGPKPGGPSHPSPTGPPHGNGGPTPGPSRTPSARQLLVAFMNWVDEQDDSGEPPFTAEEKLLLADGFLAADGTALVAREVTT